MVTNYAAVGNNVEQDRKGLNNPGSWHGPSVEDCYMKISEAVFKLLLVKRKTIHTAIHRKPKRLLPNQRILQGLFP